MNRRNAILTAVLLLWCVSGCAMYSPLDGTLDIADGIEGTHGLRYGLDAEFLNVNLDDDVKTTPVHPDDAGFLTGTTITDIEGSALDHLNVVPYVGWDIGVGTENVKVVGGAAIRFNLIALQDGYREGIHGVEQQSSDPRGSMGSFAYTYVEMGLVTLEPDVGIRIDGDNNLWAEFRVGFPYSSVDVESGWDRWGAWEKFDSSSWRGFGQRFSVTVGVAETDAGNMFLRAYYLTYDMDFGKLGGWGLAAGLEW